MAKKKTKPEDVISTSVGIIPAGRPAPVPFSRNAAVRSYAGWVYAATMIRANALASVPLRLYAKDGRAGGKRALWPIRGVGRKRKRWLAGDGRRNPHPNVISKAAELGDDFVEVMDHPALALLRKVNPWSAGFDNLRLTSIYTQATGDAYWYCDRSGVGGTPDQVINLPAQWVEVVPDKGTMVAGYLYGRDRAKTTALGTDEVVHFKVPNPCDVFYGMGWYQAAWAAIGQNVAVHEMDTAFFKNFARPDYLVTIQGPANEDALKRFQETIQASNQGTSKVGRLLAVTGQVDAKPLNFQPKDMNGREEIVEEIAAISGVPVSMLKANDPNLASAEAGFSMWREATVAVDCRFIEDVLNQLYLPMWGIEDEAVFCFDDAVRENEEAESVILDRELKSGLRTLNEGRADLGLDDYSHGYADVPLFNGQPIGMSLATMIGGSVQSGGSVPEVGDYPAPENVENQDNAEVPEPAHSEKPTGSEAVANDPNAAVQDTALNGAQVGSLLELVIQTRQGVVPVDSAQAIAAAAFPLMSPEQLAAIFNPIRSAKPLEVPEPAPKPSEERGTVSDKDEPSVDPAKGRLFVSQKAFLYGDVGCSCGSHVKGKDAPLPLSDEVSERKLREFVASLEPILKDQAEAIIGHLKGEGTAMRDILDRVQSEILNQKWVERIAKASRPYVGHALVEGMKEGVKLFPVQLQDRVSFDLANPEVQKYVDRATVNLATGVNDTTSYRVRDLLGTSMDEGKTIPEIRKAVQESTGFGATRAETIARTESARAYSQGQEESWKQSDGIVTGKTWVLAPDACEFCRAAARMFRDKPVPLGQPFFRKGETLAGVKGGTLAIDYDDINGPPLHPNDRCSIGASTS